jgi:hypothetical protein
MMLDQLRAAPAALALAFAAWPTVAGAQVPPPPEPRVWDISMTVLGFLLQDEGDVVIGIASADRQALHLEARYNYEGLRTGSVFAGRTFTVGSDGWLTLVPMAGVAFGDSDGVVPALELEALVGPLVITSENEYLFGTSDETEDFFYSWNEVSIHPVEEFRLGFAGQRMRTEASGLEWDKGIVAGVAGESVSADFYGFNMFSENEFVVVGMTVAF